MIRFSIWTVALAGTMIASAGTASATETITYTYDAKGRVVQVVHTGTINNGLQTTYTHDPADNRTHVVVIGSANGP